MTPEEHYRRLANTYRAAPTNEYYRPRITVSHGAAEISFETRADMHHSAEAVHGNHLFKLLDDAAFFAANSLVEDVFVLTASFTTYFLRPVAAGRITARGRVVKPGRRMLVAESVLLDEQGREVARGSGAFVPSGIALADTADYTA